MKQSVCSAQIDKGAEVGNILYCTFNHISYLNTLKQLSLHLRLASCHQLLPVTDNPSSARIELSYYKLDLLIRILGQVSLIGITRLAGMNTLVPSTSTLSPPSST